MLLSPPFLVAPLAAETEDQFIDRMMVVGTVGDGGYPVSFEMNWHGGVHLAAPMVAGKPTPVRAIADGKVTFVRKPTKRSADPKHALNYRGGWTDDGCVVVQHDTEIGFDAATNATTKVVFFSVYMHLGVVGKLAVGDLVFRKDVLGAPGSIYGTPNQLHLEIVCDDANVEKLTGRKSAFTSMTTEGRADVVYGKIWFFCPFDTPFHKTEPKAGKPLPPVVFTNSDEAVLISVEFTDSDAEMRTFRIDGTPIGAPVAAKNFGGGLVARAKKQYPKSPSAGVDLLRFGRVLGSDTLDPPDAPNWVQVAHPTGTGFVNLNATGVRRFSDADFPSWERGFKKGWVLADGSGSPDSRCKELRVIDLLDLDSNLAVDPKEAEKLKDPATQASLARKICKFPTEWDPATIDTRLSWLKTEKPVRLKEAEYKTLRAHVAALCFWQGTTPGIAGNHWHFHPREFIRQFRKCVWLTEDELAQCIPRKTVGFSGTTFSTHELAAFSVAKTRAHNWIPGLPLMMRRYMISNTPLRLAHFLAQVFAESGFLRFVVEIGGSKKSYAPYFGRGLIQLTHEEGYKRYGEYRNFPVTHPSAKAEFSGIKWDPDTLIASTQTVFDAPNCADTAGFYWTSPAANNGNARSDKGLALAQMLSLSKFVNGNFSEEKLNGLNERYSAFLHMKYTLLDLVRPASNTETLTFDWRSKSTPDPVMEADGVTPKKDSKGNKILRFTKTTHTVTFPVDPQRP